MQLHGHSLIAGRPSSDSTGGIFRAFSPIENAPIAQDFFEATGTDVETALNAACEAFDALWTQRRAQPADLLDAIADEIEALGPILIQQACRESGLTEARLTGERGRTTGQLRLFAGLLREGSWVNARIDPALPERTPPRSDIRLTVVPLGPVVVFAASNFPLAFSVAGGDTASALAAGCPVIVKAHPAHPGTSEMVAVAIAAAVARTHSPAGIFSLLQASRLEISIRLVEDERVRAVGFTGSLAGGRAIFDAGVRRPDPIPVYSEMASVNPVFVLPGAIAAGAAKLAGGIFASVTLGAGQFCTSPGLIVGVGLAPVAERLRALFTSAPAAAMLSPGIVKHYNERVRQVEAIEGVKTMRAGAGSGCRPSEGAPVLFETEAGIFLSQPALRAETFGASTVIVHCANSVEMERVAGHLEGSLTASLHGLPDEIAACATLVTTLQRKAGRLIFNGYPTGVEVCHAMHHGGPYPSTSDAKFTSVGTAAIYRWVRPVCFQDAPESILPEELKDANPPGILRLVNGTESRGALPPRTIQE